MNQQLGKEYRSDEPKAFKAAVSQIHDQIERIEQLRNRLRFIRDRLVGCPPAAPAPEKKVGDVTVAVVAQDTLVNDFRRITSGLIGANDDIEILLKEIEEFV